MMRLAALLIFLAVAPVAYGDGSATWEFLSETDGIKVYRRQVKDSPILALKGEGVVEASIKKVFAVFKAAERYPEWAPAVRTKRVLDMHAGRDARIEYTHVGLPWPLADRYFVTVSKAERTTGGGLFLSSSSLDGHPYEEEGKIKGHMHFSEALLEETGAAQTRVTIRVGMDPKGSLLGWLVNWSQRRWPIKFIRGLREQVVKPDVVEEAIPATVPPPRGPALLPAQG